MFFWIRCVGFCSEHIRPCGSRRHPLPSEMEAVRAKCQYMHQAIVVAASFKIIRIPRLAGPLPKSIHFFLISNLFDQLVCRHSLAASWYLPLLITCYDFVMHVHIAWPIEHSEA